MNDRQKALIDTVILHNYLDRTVKTPVGKRVISTDESFSRQRAKQEYIKLQSVLTKHGRDFSERYGCLHESVTDIAEQQPDKEPFQILSVIEAIMSKLHFCSIQLIDKFLMVNITSIFSYCRELGTLFQHITLGLRQNIKSVMIALVTTYKSIQFLSDQRSDFADKSVALARLVQTLVERRQDITDDEEYDPDEDNEEDYTNESGNFNPEIQGDFNRKSKV